MLIAGGIGITPMLSMLKAICEAGGHRETWFFYCVRNKQVHAMRAELEEISRSQSNVHLVVIYSHPSDACVEGQDYDSSGFLSVDNLRERLPSNNYEFYICGPPQMMTIMTEGLKAWDIPDESVHFEAFGAASVRKAPSTTTVDSVTEVTFQRSGKTIQWSADTGSLLDLAEANGTDLSYNSITAAFARQM